MQKLKAESASRFAAENLKNERKKNLLVLVHQHLKNCGYMEAAATMVQESNVGLEKWEAADNIDLQYVVQDFEEYFEIKFSKKPVLVRRNPNYDEDPNNHSKRPGVGARLPKINPAKSAVSLEKPPQSGSYRKDGQMSKPVKGPTSATPKNESEDMVNFEIQGK